jgi:hypothetical protein
VYDGPSEKAYGANRLDSNWGDYLLCVAAKPDIQAAKRYFCASSGAGCDVIESFADAVDWAVLANCGYAWVDGVDWI